jgi:hypothetical protein
MSGPPLDRKGISDRTRTNRRWFVTARIAALHRKNELSVAAPEMHLKNALFFNLVITL